MKYIFVFITSLFAFKANSQVITNYTTNHGLIDNFVECIDVDTEDNIWIGTSMGVQMFDGQNWILYDDISYPGLVSNNIKAIKTVSNGDIWVGTDFGVSRFDGLDWITYNSSNGLSNNQVYSIDEDSFGNIWIGTHSGVSFYDGNTWGSYGYPDLHWSGVNRTVFDSNGDIWFSCPLGGVIQKVGSNFISYDTSDGLLSQNTTDIKLDNFGNKWIGTGAGISVLNDNNSSFTHHTKMYLMPPPDTLNPVVDLEIDSYGRIWTGIYVGYLSEGGVTMWNGNQWFDYDYNVDGLVGKNIKDLAIDSENNIWIATTSGISKLNLVSSMTNNISHNFNVFPNPCNGELNVNINKLNVSSIDVYNLIGEKLYSKKINKEPKFVLKLDHLPQSIYIIKFTTDTRVFSNFIKLN
ncbi:MAG: hypothetical protein CMD02_01030 [Flavobacteriales bacterium]|nr:hypothetical protein [Flavobacteriales bacterium]